MLQPKKLKHRKPHRPDVRGNATQKTELAFGSYGLKAVTGSWVSDRQIEAARRAMTRFVKRGGKIWIRIFPRFPITAKGGEIRMGGGKGSVDRYVDKVKAGTVMFEMDGISEGVAREAFRLASHKLPVRTKILIKNES
ncbi:MAG: 50S ribosomal protein L16 [Candidatus Kerfeldbacteria bacterium CG_4_10_14_0_8_um_filter_42_10]|uniref:Large ribosomal subunit protein uL16 n=1 Tax=Candidatus Kerfeldbacteria bacterium CG_4_10_14_0_8_um_filter_42_10 TaxID=2014248 RepID=A0A2M7RI00_9BACT|nr:MAG: 50S ribosomal protein L16 [Candidatus Kerfeldbacteria bacterium CG_4_10_14_0_8_um_filter_42_10]